MTFEGAQMKCQEAVRDFAQIQLVYGSAGLTPLYYHTHYVY